MLRKLSVVAAAAAVVACAKSDAPAVDSTAASAAVTPATTAMSGAMGTVAMRDAGGRDLGALMLMESASGLNLTGSLRGLAPGSHAIHLHMAGTCEGRFASAGEHWNPTTKQHGSQNPAGPHLGDMANISVGADSTASINVSTMSGTLRGADALLDADGASVVVHASADDMRSDPAGNSGDRIACGVVK